jgi:hypothetical protein
MTTHGKARIGRRDSNDNNQVGTNVMNYKHRVENEEALGLCSIENLGPSGSKGKLIKLKNNRGLISAPKNAKISSYAFCMYTMMPALLEMHNII